MVTDYLIYRDVPRSRLPAEDEAAHLRIHLGDLTFSGTMNGNGVVRDTDAGARRR
jgi:hypothetical protein